MQCRVSKNFEIELLFRQHLKSVTVGLNLRVESSEFQSFNCSIVINLVQVCDPIENHDLGSDQLKKNLELQRALNLSLPYCYTILVNRDLDLTGVKC